MAKIGGYREGSGRKKGSANKKSREIADKAAELGITPLEYMLQILRDDAQPGERRDWAAEKAAPYMHPRLQTTTLQGDDKKPLIVELVKFADQATR